MQVRSTSPTVVITSSSGRLRVTVCPSHSWLVVLLISAAILFFGVGIYTIWPDTPPLLRVLYICALVCGFAALILQLSSTEIIEIDSEKLTICRELRGWERRREFNVKDCRELEWMLGSEDTPQGLQVKVRWGVVTFGDNLTEDQALQILTALQETVPSAAQQMCSYPDGKKRFLTLGL